MPSWEVQRLLSNPHLDENGKETKKVHTNTLACGRQIWSEPCISYSPYLCPNLSGAMPPIIVMYPRWDPLDKGLFKKKTSRQMGGRTLMHTNSRGSMGNGNALSWIKIGQIISPLRSTWTLPLPIDMLFKKKHPHVRTHSCMSTCGVVWKMERHYNGLRLGK